MGSSVTMDLASGIIGLPDGTKESGTRVDFDPDDFNVVIETKGYRVAWSRAAYCPCASVNDQTKQPDPNCLICRGSGWLYFAPTMASTSTLKVGKLDDVQTRIVNDDAAAIYAIMSGITEQKHPYDPIGSRITGQNVATVRAENKLGYYDRITNLDSLIVYSELLDALDPTLPLKTRYPIVRVNLLRSFTTVFQGVDTPTPTSGDFSLSSDGDILWNTANSGASIPKKDEILGIHYLCHPTWLVMEYPHAIRLTPTKFKQKKPTAPAGTPTELPIQARIQLEFLPDLV